MNRPATASNGGARLTPGVWIAAVAELAVAVAVAVLIQFGQATPAPASMSDMPVMPSTHHGTQQLTWSAGSLAVVLLTAATLACWLVTRARVLAVCAAFGLVAVVMSGPVRALAMQSHLVAMAALELALVVAPLLLVTATPRPQSSDAAKRSPTWTIGVIAAATSFGVFLTVLHLPHTHRLIENLTAIPAWLPLVAVVIGVSYWSGILLTADRVGATVRRTALIGGQEVGAILGLAALVLPSSDTHHASPLGISSMLDQRLGGALMVLTCAAAALPMLRRLDREQLAPEFRSELYVH